jgi:pSer/pThr/pTyr-binding forkhead associated (FHA) protein
MTEAHAGGGPASERLLLDVVAGKAVGFSITVDQRLVIGRQSEGPGCLADDLELSRHHAEISSGSGGEYTIKDLSSTNGTFVNSKRLNAPAVLHTGDAIEVGGTTLVVRSAPEVPPPVTTAPVDVRAATVSVAVPAAMRDSESAAPPSSELEALPPNELEAPPTSEPEALPPSEPEAPPPSEPEAPPPNEPEAPPPSEPEAPPPSEPEAPPPSEPEAPPPSELEAPPPSEPEAPPPSEPEALQLPLLELRVVLDFERAEAQIALEEGGEVVRVRLDAGRWQFGDRAG